ncbi:MAG: hypothetical protein JSR48_04250 [Verrucomicrobia bacterium]|nr:hypothetical protein [Verrucomicrobiota bacterium]
MSAPPESRVGARLWWSAGLLALLVFAGRSALVFYAGSPVPFHDQWIAEAEQLLVHDAHHTLTWHNFFVPHSDHLHVPTRLIAYTLYRLTGRWDMLAEMLVNNALIAAAFGWLYLHFRRTAPAAGIGWAAVVVGAWLASPLFYGNALWGFQSSVEILVLTAVVQLIAVHALRGFDRHWGLMVVAGVVGVISFGSGGLASLIAALVCLHRLREPAGPRRALVAAFIVNLAIGAASWLVVRRSPSLEQSAFNPGNVVHTVLHALSWPAMQPSWFALLLWLPALAATVAVLRGKAGPWLPAYALAAWTILQIAGVAAIRSAPVPALPPRYYDFLAVGVVANALLAHGLLAAAAGRPVLRWAALILLLAWGVGTVDQGFAFARSHTIHDVPTLRGYAVGQIDLLQRYYAGGGAAALGAAEFPVRPYPEVPYLQGLLEQPVIRDALPAYLKAPPPLAAPELTSYRWPVDGPRRSTWFSIAIGVALGAAMGLVLLAGFRFRLRVQVGASR